MTIKKNLFKIIIFLIISLLIIIVFFTGTIWKNINNLQNDINKLEYQIHNLQTFVNKEAAYMKSDINQLQQKDIWWTRPFFNFIKTSQNKYLVQASWQLKEFTKDTNVIFNYLPEGEKEYRQLPAKEKSQGLFEITLPLELQLAPLININHLQHSKVENKSITPNIVKEISNKGEQYLLQYYISIQDNKKIRTSKKYSYNLNQLSYNLFNPLQVNFSTIEDSIKITIIENLENYNKYKRPFTISEIFLQTRKEDNIKETWTADLFIPPEYEGRDKFYSPHKITPKEEYKSLYMIVEYSQGLTIEKEIYVKNNY